MTQKRKTFRTVFEHELVFFVVFETFQVVNIQRTPRQRQNYRTSFTTEKFDSVGSKTQQCLPNIEISQTPTFSSNFCLNLEKAWKSRFFRNKTPFQLGMRFNEK